MRKFYIILLFIIVFSMSGCSSGYGLEEAIKRGDIVYQNKVYNFDRFEQFLSNISKNKKDTIRVTGYTDEGDPIYKDLEFDGKSIQYKYDNSNDAFGGNDKGVETDVCSKIVEEENVPGEIDYVINGCSKNSDISHFLFRMERKK
ncbi:DUF4362 domain-containing protein [Heyndrickxia sp. NPDC080065]|uniref:DUF4362 domain-containing protein n=1 Tax=Heyndrickxia sp. NPDC080065 TaxID=3390568 RepID=UPI003D007D39